LALNHLLGNPLPIDTLAEMALSLGADVPFFLLEKSAWAKGIGERLKPLDSSPKHWFVLVNPGFAVSTSWVFENFDSSSQVTKINSKKLENLPWIELLRNDLERVTLKAHPVLAEIKNEMISLGAQGALMSGSGPTVFGIFVGEMAENQAKKAGKRLCQNKNWKVFTACNI
jgi:4-diphosphocytidyl-2-C-methyl-D-erythritol kinase